MTASCVSWISVLNQGHDFVSFIYPYDAGVFMYASFDTSIPRVSNIQAYLDLYAQGGRDLKQADYLLDTPLAALGKPHDP